MPTAPLSLLVAVLALLGALPLAGQEWSGTITMVESLVGPGNVGGSDRTELDEYARQLKERLQRAQQEVHTVPLTVARILREDIGTFQAELERVVLASGEAVRVGTSIFFIKGGRMLVGGDGPRLVVDRARNQELVYVGGQREVVALAPLPALRELDKGTEVTLLGLPARRFTMRAEGKTCTVVLAPGLPNPYAIGLLPAAADEKDSIPLNLATLPGLPLLVEYKSDEVTHRWAVLAVDARPIDDRVFTE